MVRCLPLSGWNDSRALALDATQEMTARPCVRLVGYREPGANTGLAAMRLSAAAAFARTSFTPRGPKSFKPEIVGRAGLRNPYGEFGWNISGHGGMARRHFPDPHKQTLSFRRARCRRTSARHEMRTLYAELSRAGIRATASRIAVLKLFRDHPVEHFSADQIYRRLTHDEEPLSLASVYRILSQLLGAGLITCASLGDSRVVYELNRGEPHYHLVCNHCGAIHNVTDTTLNLAYQSIAAQHQFVYASASVVVFGACPDCQAARNQKARSG
ncbi:Fe2+ or Zn2+ uptake regulation protein [Paraburkholderia caballeronis]|uniref:Fe2+ or Zn2+ uptake regulation protein n=2 Tax=Paraburkholderia caballeronis TaxID=416943 RepID=A0A1H7WCX2_9BURK|nr:Fe2+ or Zn2+ uptake regulation protein [Paraburkholderia caballeronis]PXW92387.1 Fe2+ or Zn2+ uptake regulation protein [Paraburkholderia caballeronis]RAJ86591.1 Fe2+ or Zn2+ uptake regulation protein [Paraburkholderia caballeronis]SEE63997.1 Fe2+ or Zn2+ uptake regulation protein [Paraburkholderia caballeronis]SEM18767.1 Fe2+ or Zn2+ uptake regulation protein [Paraburkholderia caballeronis]